MVPGKSQDTSSTSIHELSSLTDAHPNSASAFHVVSSEKLGITRRIDSETVEYGDLVFLQTASGCTLPVIFVCPGRTGPVCRGHHVFMIHLSVQGRMRAWVTSPQSTTRSGALQLVDDPNDFNRAPTCFTLRSPLDAGAACQSGTGSKRATRTEKRPLPGARSQRQPSSQPGATVPLQVISHNVWLEPKLTSSWQLLSKRVSPRKRTRAHAIPDALQRAISGGESNVSDLTPDVIVITGAFCSTATGILRARLKRDLHMPFESPVLDHAGIFISSRFPIERTALFRFDASQKDRSVSRAAIYVRVRKQGKCVHLFAANVHPGTSTSTLKIRESQLCALRQWIQNLRLPEDEPVLITGDLRTCRASQHDAYERMLDILGAEDAAHIPPDLLATIQTSCQDINAMLASTKSFAARWSSSSRTSNARGSSSASSSSTASSAALAPSSDAVTMSTPRRPATVYSLMEPAIRNVLTVNPACNALTMRLGRGPSLADTILISRKHGIAQDPVFQVLANAATAVPYSITSQAEASDLSTHYPVALSLSL
ncbi:Hypothetical Protein FCC1311_045302 [Hondaea fermentalgiana]|uniref:Uncharacterized protein n=1 Tax=Hondaea fermentalgiana TaxID=2315210 RepID=A0A2R5GBD4_9STRA|nr:Hypothetical Protein FCC1311_045302 [Hondaea fermentalgiana]|eukprot:GBG28307.1 Hypothetical Protein FCC1311_045302 [Hondaea fermentalgiana]